MLPAAESQTLPAAPCQFHNPGSLVVVSSTPTLGGTVTLAQDLANPTSQLVGSKPILIIAFAPTVNYPCGIPVAGLGNPGGKMELVVDMGLSFMVAYPLSWAGPGNPALWPLGIPADPNAAGVHLYFQGVFLPPAFPGKSTLTEGVEIKMGLY